MTFILLNLLFFLIGILTSTARVDVLDRLFPTKEPPETGRVPNSDSPISGDY